MESRVERARKNNIEKVSGFFIIVGISIITAIVSTKIIPIYSIRLSELLGKFSLVEFSIIIVSIIAIIEGMYLYSKPQLIESKNIFFLWPYILILPIILIFYLSVADGIELSKIDALVIYLFIFWLGVYYELKKFIMSTNKILRSKIKEDKERLAIIITIIATIISAVAIFT